MPNKTEKKVAPKDKVINCPNCGGAESFFDKDKKVLVCVQCKTPIV